MRNGKVEAAYREGRQHEARMSILCFLGARGASVPEAVQRRLREASVGELGLLRLELYGAADPEAVALRFAGGCPGRGDA